MNTIGFKQFHPKAIMPGRAHHTDAGLDLYAVEHHTLVPGSIYKIPTGVGVQIPEGYVGKIFDRSSMAMAGLTTRGGVIDAGYNGEIQVIIVNEAHATRRIAPGDKIAQLLIQPIHLGNPMWVKTLPDTERGEGGFGSTGK